MTAKATPSHAKMPATYEAALAELQTLVQTLEAGQTPLDALFESYQRGAQLLQFCQERLAAVQEQIQTLESDTAPISPHTN